MRKAFFRSPLDWSRRHLQIAVKPESASCALVICTGGPGSLPESTQQTGTAILRPGGGECVGFANADGQPAREALSAATRLNRRVAASRIGYCYGRTRVIG